jgi:hypothetical protein
MGAEFSEADFTRAKFSKLAVFSYTIFSEAHFYKAEFSEANFMGAEFSEANFMDTNFLEAYFIGAKFSKVYFNRARFHGKTVFDFSTFSGPATFINSVFLPDLPEKCVEPHKYISFRRVKFEKPEEVIFDNCNMERVSFLHTNIERVKFRNVNWKDFRIYDEELFLLKISEGKRKKFTEECKKKHKNALDIPNGKMEYKEIKKEITEEEEKRLKELIKKRNKKIKNEIEKVDFSKLEEDKDLTLDNVLAVYRNLRENYDYYMKYDESGKFFVNEMKLKKRFSNFVEKIVMSVYEVLCLYGESYSRTLVLAALTIILFAALRTHLSQILTIESFLDSLKISITIFFQIYFDNSWITILERLISIPILGTLYIALRRKLERRVRH